MKKPMRVLIVIIILILIGAGLYWAGLYQGRSNLETERKNFNSQLEQMNYRLVSAEYNVRLNRARYLLCRAVMDLDQHNFGLANDHVKGASAALGNINPSMIGIEPGRFESLRKEIEATNISVAFNLEEQRGKVFSLSQQLESLIPVTPAPAFQSPAPKPAPPAAPAQPVSPAPGQTTAPPPAAK